MAVCHLPVPGSEWIYAGGGGGDIRRELWYQGESAEEEGIEEVGTGGAEEERGGVEGEGLSKSGVMVGGREGLVLFNLALAFSPGVSIPQSVMTTTIVMSYLYI